MIDIQRGGGLNPIDIRQSIIVDDFLSGNLVSGSIGQLGWLIYNGNILEGTAAATQHPGYVFLETGTTTDTNSVLQLKTASGFVLSHVSDTRFIIGSGISDITNTTVRFGYATSGTPIGNPPSNGVYFEKLSTDTNWFAVIRVSDVDTRTDMGITYSTNTWYRLRIRKLLTGSAVPRYFTVNNSAEISITADPAGVSFNHFAQIINVGTAVNKSFRLDFFSSISYGINRN